MDYQGDNQPAANIVPKPSLPPPTTDHFAVSNMDPSSQLDPKEEAKLQKRLKEMDDSEQYTLVAKMDGWLG